MQLIRNQNRRKSAQGMLEYILLVGIIVTALVAMTNSIKRGTQSIVKVAADQIGFQQNADQRIDNQTGYVNSQNISSQDSKEKRIIERVGVLNYISNDSSLIVSQTLTNSGFTEDPQ